MSGVIIMRIPISLPCVVPVRPADGVAAIDGEPLPIEERTEKCCRDAFWTFELAPVCDMHLREICPVAGDDYASLIEAFQAENPGYDGPSATERLPWDEGHRYPQEQARMLGES